MVKTWPFKRLLVTSICIKLSSCPEQFAEKTLCYTKVMMRHKRRIAFRMPPKRPSAHLPWSGWRLVHGPLNEETLPEIARQQRHRLAVAGRSCGPERCPHIEQPPWQGPQFFSFRRGVPDECQLDPEDARHSWSYVDLLRQWRAKGKSRKGKTIENPLVEACTCRGQTAKLFTEVGKLLQKAVAKAEDVIHVQAFDVHREKQQAVEDDPSLVSFLCFFCVFLCLFCVFLVSFCVFFVSFFVPFLCLCVFLYLFGVFLWFDFFQSCSTFYLGKIPKVWLVFFERLAETPPSYNEWLYRLLPQNAIRPEFHLITGTRILPWIYWNFQVQRQTPIFQYAKFYPSGSVSMS